MPAPEPHSLENPNLPEQSSNYDDVKQYRLDPEREQELVNTAGECVFCWANKAGHPIGVITAYVPHDGKIWMTATRERVRIKAIARDGRSSVVISSKGTPMGGKYTYSNSVYTDGRTLAHAGWGGQYLYVDPKQNLVVAYFSTLQNASGLDVDYAPMMVEMVEAISAYFDGLSR